MSLTGRMFFGGPCFFEIDKLPYVATTHTRLFGKIKTM